MAVIMEGGCRVSDMREGGPLQKGTLHIWKQIGRATGARAISLRVMEFSKGLSPTIRNDDCDEILFVLDDGNGGGAVKLFINECAFQVGSDSGIYVRPGETFGFYNPGAEPITVISAQCPDPDREPEFGQSSQSPGAVNEPRIVRLADRPAQPTADRWYRVLVDDEVGSAQVTQFVGSIPPGRAPDHFHQYEEVLFILKGGGLMWAGKSSTPIGPGSCIYLPSGQVHCVENTGDDELRLLGVFYPAGSPSVRYEV